LLYKLQDIEKVWKILFARYRRLKQTKKDLKKSFSFTYGHEQTFARTSVRKGGGGFSKIPNKCSYIR
jgi:hypothetical protein